MRTKHKPTRIRGTWPLGCIPEIRKDPIRFGSRIALENPPLVEVSVFGDSVYFTADAAMAHEILVRSAHLTHRGANYRTLESLAGINLFTAEGDYWQHQRKTMQPGMSHLRYDGYVRTFVRLAESLADEWKALDGQEIRMGEAMSIFTLQAISRTLFSCDILSGDPGFIRRLFRLLRFINLRYYDVLQLPLWLPLPSFRTFRRNRDALDATILQRIRERRASGAGPGDMLDLLVAGTDASSGNPLSDRQVRDEVLTLMAAGFKTTSAVLCMIWFQLSKNPAIAGKMAAEHEAVIGNQSVRFDHLSELTYTRCVILEALRMCPAAFAVPRNFRQDVRDFGGVSVKGGKRVITSIYGIHHNPAYWPDPFRFDPDRFVDAEKEYRRQGVFLPFGAGRRTCLGAGFAMLEMLSFLAVMVRKYSPECREAYVPRMIAAIAIQFGEDLPMVLRRRAT